MEKIDVEKMIDERLAHKENVNKTVISGLFYDFKEEVMSFLAKYDSKEEVVVALTKIEMKLGELANYQKIANGRTNKLEEEVAKLKEVDVLISERVKNLRTSGEKTNGRIWQVIIGVVVAMILSALGYIIKTI